MVYPKYCFSTTEGTFRSDSLYAKELGIYIFYDEKKDIFIDKDNNIVDIKEMDLFPRTGVLQAKALVDSILKHGGKPLVTHDDYETTLNWPNYVKTNRKNVIMSGKEIIENPNYILELFGEDSVFFKTKNKNYSGIIEIEKLLNKDDSFYKAISAHLDDDFIISEVIDIVQDEYGPLEYRGFVVNGKLLNVSRVHDFLLCTVPENVVSKMQQTIEELDSTSFPKSFVVDVFVCRDDKENTFVDVLECNPIVASGTYLYNSVFDSTEDFLHKCPSASIPVEKIKYGYTSEYGFDVKNKPIPSICYQLPGGFAADILSFAFFDAPSNGMFLHIDSFSSLSLGNLGLTEVISSDSDFESEDHESSKEKVFRLLKEDAISDDNYE